ncbi:hypothetical protein EC960109_1529B, partial [Escherichia coli 96.0109]
CWRACADAVSLKVQS